MGFWPGILWMSARMLVHPGKAKEKPQGKTSFPLGFSWLSVGQKPSIFRVFLRQADVVCLSNSFNSPIGVQRPKVFGAGLGTRSAQE